MEKSMTFEIRFIPSDIEAAKRLPPTDHIKFSDDYKLVTISTEFFHTLQSVRVKYRGRLTKDLSIRKKIKWYIRQIKG